MFSMFYYIPLLNTDLLVVFPIKTLEGAINRSRVEKAIESFSRFECYFGRWY